MLASSIAQNDCATHPYHGQMHPEEETYSSLSHVLIGIELYFRSLGVSIPFCNGNRMVALAV